MDAHAHLLSLGWAGPGHSLDSRPQLQHKGRRGLAYDPSLNNNTGRGLVKPLLVSQKKNAFGIGKKAHEPVAGNEWWLKGFENALSNIGKKSVSEATSGTATPESNNKGIIRGRHIGLYGFFVKGQEMEGTINEDRVERSRGQKRKSDTFDDEESVSTSSGTSTPGRSMSRKKPGLESKATADFAQISHFLDIRDKDRRREERTAKSDPTFEFEQMGCFFEAGSKRKKKHVRKNEKVDQHSALSETERIVEVASTGKRGCRKRHAENKDASVSTAVSAEQKKQERKSVAAATKSSKLPEKESVWSKGSRQAAESGAESPASTNEALRRAERKRRKELKRASKVQVDC